MTIACPYVECRMVNLCKGDHCVREGLERDGWVLGDNGELRQIPLYPDWHFPHAPTRS